MLWANELNSKSVAESLKSCVERRRFLPTPGGSTNLFVRRSGKQKNKHQKRAKKSETLGSLLPAQDVAKSKYQDEDLPENTNHRHPAPPLALTPPQLVLPKIEFRASISQAVQTNGL